MAATKKFLKLGKYLPSLLVLALCLSGVWMLWTPSSTPEIFLFSYFRFSALLLLFLTGSYFALSMGSRRLRGFNNSALFILVATLVLHEAVIRIFPAVIGDKTLLLLPNTVRQEITNKRDLALERTVQGDGMLYSWKPGFSPEKHPWAVADANGFRNDTIPKGAIDTVLLGPSTILSATTKKDLGRLLNESGIKTYSLAMGSYSPQQFRDAYRKYIIDPGIRHRNVIVFLMIPYDLNKAILYSRVKGKGGNWKDYLAPPNLKPAMFNEKYLPWTISILLKLPYYIAQKIKTSFRESDTQEIVAELDYVVHRMKASHFKEPPLPYGWPPLEKAIKEIAALAKKNGAFPYLAYMPHQKMWILPYIKGDWGVVKRMQRTHNKNVVRMKKIALENEIRFLDLTASFQGAFAEKKMADSLNDMHLNQDGIIHLSKEVHKTLTK